MAYKAGILFASTVREVMWWASLHKRWGSRARAVLASWVLEEQRVRTVDHYGCQLRWLLPTCC